MKKILTAIVGSIISVAAYAGTASNLVERVSSETLIELKKNPAAKTDKNVLFPLLEKNVTPYFDFTSMTMLACGKECKTVDVERKGKMTEAFKKLLMTTYAKALMGDGAEAQVKVKSEKADGSDVVVKTEVILPGRKPIAIDYYVQPSPKMEWQVKDVVVEGVSIVVNYRETFKQEIQKAGVDGLITSLENKVK